MTQSPQANKDIVSKREFAKVQSKRVAIGFLGVSFYITAVIFGAAGVLLIAVLTLMLNQPQFFFPKEGDGFAVFYIIPLALIFVLATPIAVYLFRRGGLHMMKTASEARTCIPFTCANTADLPAPNSLVRASAEPVQKQQDVLLRAAAENTETPAEHLVRAVHGPE